MSTALHILDLSSAIVVETRHSLNVSLSGTSFEGERMLRVIFWLPEGVDVGPVELLWSISSVVLHGKGRSLYVAWVKLEGIDET